jgi:Ca2+-binding RTX toxin-like protein
MGPQIHVNTTTALWQSTPSIAMFKDGSFIVVWQDDSKLGTDTQASSIRGQIFNADGTKRGAELNINSTIEKQQGAPTVAVLSDGRFVVSWTDSSGKDSEIETGIRARVFKADGEPVGNDFRVNTNPNNSQGESSITALANGGFAISWNDLLGDGSAFAVEAQSFNADMSRNGSERVVNSTVTDSQFDSTIIGLQNGYLVVYSDSSASPDDPGQTVRGRLFGFDGAPVPGTAEFVIPSSRGDKDSSAATQLADGRFVVVWTHRNDKTGDGSGACIKGQIYHANGTPYRGEFLVNTTVQSDQSDPVITALPDGGFAVAFTDSSASRYDIRMVTFDSKGISQGDDVLIAATQGILKKGMTVLADGRVVVTWDEVDTTRLDDPSNVRAQIVDPRGNGIVMNGTAADDHYIGTAFNDVLNSAGGNDRLSGQGGNDVLDGGVGNDVMDGGFGDDTYYIDSLGDVIADAGGIDTVVTSLSYTLSASVENLTALETGALTLTGNAFNNTIIGNGSSNRIDGGFGNDTLSGGFDNDTLAGGLGNDVLTGGAGRDFFRFDTRPNRSVNKDVITDWNYREDTIQLENAVFRKLTKTGKLHSKYFTLGAKAKDANDFIGVNKTTGDVWYDSNGNKAGGQVIFANIGAKKAIFASDFVVI